MGEKVTAIKEGIVNFVLPSALLAKEQPQMQQEQELFASKLLKEVI